MDVDILLAVSDNSLDFVRVDDSGDIGVGNFMMRKSPSFLLGAGLLVGSKDIVQFFESTFGPDYESSDMTSRGKLEKVKSANMSNFNSWDVSEGLDEGYVSSTIDNKGSSSTSVSSVSEFSLSGSNFDGINDFLNISPSTNILKEFNSLFSAFDFLGIISNNERELWHGLNSVSSGLNKRKDS